MNLGDIHKAGERDEHVRGQGEPPHDVLQLHRVRFGTDQAGGLGAP
jgi:hypothetical protein